MKTKASRRILLAVLAVALLCGTAFAAGEYTKNITAYYSGIKIVLDGVEITPTDASGNVVEPFIADGTTYLPVRAVGNALGLPVDWDGETRTVYLGELPGQEDNWMTKLPPYQISGACKIYDGTNPRESFSVAGITQTQGVLFSSFFGNEFAIWNTNSQYSTMTVTVGHAGNDTNNAKLEVYLDGEYSTEYEFKYDEAPKTINIPLKYSPNVKLVFIKTSNNMGANYAIYDISFS